MLIVHRYTKLGKNLVKCIDVTRTKLENTSLSAHSISQGMWDGKAEGESGEDDRYSSAFGQTATNDAQKRQKSRFAPHNSGFSQKEAKTPRGIHHGGTVTDDPQKYKIPVEE